MHSHDLDTVIDKIKDHFNNRELNYFFDEELRVFQFGIGTKKYLVVPKDHCVTVYLILPLQNNKKCDKIQEFLSRANYGLTLGNFEYDIRDGEIRYKISFLLPIDLDSVFENDLIFDSISICSLMCDRYCKGLSNIIFKDMPAEQAVKMCEE